ncbi:MAG: hypothetical protein Q9M48_15845 [Rhodobacterales bacterium]|nr:hypothetical protein [Rhodobacterales bacterium]
MKFTKSLPLVGAVTLMASVIAAPSFAAPQSYPMVCRAGGNMYVQVSLRTDDVAVLEVNYARAAAPANTQMPAPGTCAWPRRVLNPDEPVKMQLAVNNAGWLDIRCTRGFCEVQTSSSEVMELFSMPTGGLPFQVDVYNDRNGHMNITRVGP